MKLGPIPGAGPETRPYASRTGTRPLPPPEKLPSPPVRLPAWPVTKEQVIQMARDGFLEGLWCYSLCRSRMHVAAVCAVLIELDAKVRELQRQLADDTVVIEVVP